MINFSACICLMTTLFVVKYDSYEEINLEMMMSGEDNSRMMERIYNNDTYNKALKLWLPFLNKRGFLDTLIVKDQKFEVVMVE